MKRFLNLYVFPKLFFLPYYFSRCTLIVLNTLGFNYFNRRYSIRKRALIIEAEEQGWSVLIELKELHQSAVEYWGKEKVHRLAVTKEKSYLSQLWKVIDDHNSSHYMYDPRTGDQGLFSGIFEALRISFMFFRKGIVPICVLTDLPVRAWRIKCSIISSFNGLVLTLMSPRDVRHIFPHSRITGPMLMPFSINNLEYLIELRKKVEPDPKMENACVFTGALYEPRTTILENIRYSLENTDKRLVLKTRKLGEPRASEEQYWINIIQGPIAITTANQLKTKDTDWSFIPHLIYRYLEVTAAGSALLAQPVPGLERYFQEDVHYISFRNEEEAVEKINHYLSHPDERKAIAQKGFEKARDIIKSQMYWVIIDSNLKRYSIKD